MTTIPPPMLARTFCALAMGALLTAQAMAQTAAPSAPAPEQAKAGDGPLAALAWLDGCWRGTVNKREYREHWMPLRGSMLIGVSETVSEGRTQDFEYLRLEARPDGVHYVASSPGKKEEAFRLTEQTVDRTNDRNDAIFVFANPGQGFPQKITYRRGSEGWLYATVEGKIDGADRQVVYPMRRVDCESGELIPR